MSPPSTVPGLTLPLEKYHPHANEPYNRSRQLINEANAAHHRKVKGKAFKLNNHPGAFSFIATSCLTPVEPSYNQLKHNENRDKLTILTKIRSNE